MNYTISLARETDLNRLEEIYAYARQFMKETGNPHQWGDHNPPTSQLALDIEGGKLYTISCNGKIHGVFYFYIGEDPTYLRIEDGTWHSDACYGTIHRIAGDGSGGIVEAAVAFCQKQISYLRIDTHEDNSVMQHVLEKNGFCRCGVIYLENGSPRIAYDLIKG